MSSRIFTGNDLNGRTLQVEVEGSRIASVRELPHQSGLPRLLPLLTELQHNGAMGFHYDDITGPEDLDRIADTLLKHGVGRCLATLVQKFTPERLDAQRRLEQVRQQSPKFSTLFFGYFQEGIFMSPLDGWRGSHTPDRILPPDWDIFRRIDDALDGHIHTVNLAPELPGAMEFLDRAVAAGKKVSLGHCCPDSATIREAVKRGADRVTHFGNGAAPTIHRFKNPFWEFLNNDGLKLGLICDGFHLPPELVGTALKVKGKKNCYPVSDAAKYSGLPPGPYADGTIVLEPDGFLHVAGQEILAGSSQQQDTCVGFLMEKLGFTLEEAWRQCSLIPAAAAGIELPELKPGEEASFVVVAERGRQAFIEETVFLGQSFRP